MKASTIRNLVYFGTFFAAILGFTAVLTSDVFMVCLIALAFFAGLLLGKVFEFVYRSASMVAEKYGEKERRK